MLPDSITSAVRTVARIIHLVSCSFCISLSLLLSCFLFLDHGEDQVAQSIFIRHILISLNAQNVEYLLANFLSREHIHASCCLDRLNSAQTVLILDVWEGSLYAFHAPVIEEAGVELLPSILSCLHSSQLGLRQGF